MRWRSRRAGLVSALAVTLGAASASAQIDARSLVRAVTHPESVEGGASCRDALPAAFRAPSGSRLSVLVEAPLDGLPPDVGWRQVAPGFVAGELRADELLALDPSLRVAWSLPYQLQLDRASQRIAAPAFRRGSGSSGQGAAVGLVDAGIDAGHPDFRDSNGGSRIAWYIDLARAPAGRHPRLEEEYGCTGGADFQCAIFDAADIDELLQTPESSDEPVDQSGHGTHVASMAAGNGLADPSAGYVGVAPEATLLVARATRGATRTILDADALLATRFIFDRAAEMGLPVVVNLSLGTDLGAHDGTSHLERGLASFVGPDQPGRAIVVAAGNSGTLLTGLTDRYPEPLGIHTEVHVADGAATRVPILTPPTGSPLTRATLLVWMTARPGERVSVGVDDHDGRWISPVPPGEARTVQDGELEVTILNGTGELFDSIVQPDGAVVVIDGAWESGATFALRLEGQASMRLWVQSRGDLSRSTGSIGALFPRARLQGTINIPATHPALIAVGATVNRVEWMDRRGDLVGPTLDGPFGAVPVDSIPGFTTAGPTATGRLKPDLLAPGALVVGAMSSLADPSRNRSTSVFNDTTVCAGADDCQVVSDSYAIASGTSVAAPLVAGAAALLLASAPSLTQDRLLGLLQAGARRPRGGAVTEQQAGPGVLELERSLEALQITQEPSALAAEAVAVPVQAASSVTLSDSYAHPDPDWPLRGLVLLRTEEGAIAHGFDPSRLRLEVSPGRVVEPLSMMAPGLWSFAAAAPLGSGGERLRLTLSFDERVVARREVPIAVDAWVAEEGVSARGGCAMPSGRAPVRTAWLVLVAALWVVRRRRARWDRSRG